MPRLACAAQPALNKVYVIRGNDEGHPDADPNAAFLRHFLPELDRVLFPRSGVPN